MLKKKQILKLINNLIEFPFNSIETWIITFESIYFAIVETSNIIVNKKIYKFSNKIP